MYILNSWSVLVRINRIGIIIINNYPVNEIVKYLIAGIFLVLISSTLPFVYAQEIPDWLKTNVSWWADGILGDQEFVQSMSFLINEDILVVPPTTIPDEKSEKIPEWVKNNGKWWTDGIISDVEFLDNIQYLIANGIITIGAQSVSDDEIEMKTESVFFEASGKFSDGDFFHRTSGIASIKYSAETGGVLNFDNTFNTVLGHDLFVYLATDKSANDFVNVGRLQSSSGEQSYVIPTEIDLGKYDNVLVWCKSFGALFGNVELSN